jgi:hypothetical protein
MATNLRIQVSIRSQRGFALIALLAILTTGILYVLLDRLDASAIRRQRDDVTAQALARAKDALIGYAASSDPPGALLCPDTATNTGVPSVTTSDCAGSNYIGRLPWKTLGLGDLRDGNGQCLWYAISPVFRNKMTSASRIALPLNTSTAGTITLQFGSGTNLPAPPNPVAAVIIAAGMPIGSQDQATSGSPLCGGNTLATNYLDIGPAPNYINNATGNISGSNMTFVTDGPSASFNDRFVYITAAELMDAVGWRIATDIRGTPPPNPKGLSKYFADHGALPAPVAGLVPSGLLDYDTDTLTWLTENNWFGLVGYSTPTSSQAVLTVGGKAYTYNFPTSP